MNQIQDKVSAFFTPMMLTQLNMGGGAFYAHVENTFMIASFN